MRSRIILAVIAACGIAPTLPAKAPATSSLPPSVTRLVDYAPLPEYPDDFRRRQIHGSGVFLLRVQIKTGQVTQVITAQSTGNWALDGFAQKALRTWRFKPGVIPYHKITSVRLSPPQTKDEALVKLPLTF